ncbi:FadR/GntR family transcriptional regulator [Devosia sp. Root635]|uniref:FadR/GntR family transcriptional regulator n=1 Tax=Devosia sp. Root635 TaxID=1736575 RepID=UPI0006FD65BF|nr:FadR/GntR family transcriptional regulator [Devosia sp. Root635]KRA44952.1 GntR family transcriptional regulator [Devosia sp. Root635]
MTTATLTVRRARGGLVKRIIGELRGAILAGQYAVGDKLPSQAELAERYQVSRTVVREAIAGLQADGLVEPHQGAGVFVTSRLAPASPFGALDVARVSSILETLELRAAVEVEAAGLAALRRSPAQEEAIVAAHKALVSQIADGGSSIRTDFEFHRAIAAATNNRRFVELLDLMGASAIPEIMRQGYLDMIIEEHRAIAYAISAGDEAAAREAMRVHVRGSQRRYRQLLHGDLT